MLQETLEIEFRALFPWMQKLMPRKVRRLVPQHTHSDATEGSKWELEPLISSREHFPLTALKHTHTHAGGKILCQMFWLWTSSHSFFSFLKTNVQQPKQLSQTEWQALVHWTIITQPAWIQLSSDIIPARRSIHLESKKFYPSVKSLADLLDDHGRLPGRGAMKLTPKNV